MSKKLILLVGTINSGKTTAANILRKYGFVEKTFAAPLKGFACSIGFTQQQIYGDQKEKLEINKFWGISGREFMQKFGSEVCRTVLPNCIPNMNLNHRTLWARTIEQSINRFPLVVISDGRFQDEAQLVRDYNGIIIRLSRDKGQINNEASDHISESENLDIICDYKINNNGSRKDLESALFKILENENLFLVPLKQNNEGRLAHWKKWIYEKIYGSEDDDVLCLCDMLAYCIDTGKSIFDSCRHKITKVD
jgi:hypothetical protein